MRTLGVVLILLLLSRGAFAGAIDKARLEQVISALPDVKLDPKVAAQLVAEAVEAAGTDLDPFVLLAQAYVESRFDPSATSRLIAGKRRVGPWRSSQAPTGWSGNLYCGIAQTAASTWAACLTLRGSRAAFTAQAHELRTWIKRTDGDLLRAIAGFGCGNSGVTRGSCRGYPQRILALARRLHVAASGLC